MPSIQFSLSRKPAAASLLLLVLSASACSTKVKPDVAGQTDAPVAKDERINRGVFAFNQGLDRVILKPMARGYSHAPVPVKHGVRNFVRNIGEPLVFANDLLQANFLRSLNTAGRFVVNSTVGVIGIFDVAGRWGMPYHGADLGQTFGVWGMGPGHTVELPLFGSSNLRDTVGRVLTIGLYNLGENSDTVQTLNTVKTVGGIVDGRASALPLTDKLSQSPDYYAALRDTAASRRQKFVEEGREGSVTEKTRVNDDRGASGLPIN